MRDIMMNRLTRAFVLIMFTTTSGYASAHEWTPTYPKLKLSHIPAVYKAEMRLFNSRNDILYYQLSVHEEDWTDVPFAITTNSVAKNTVQIGFQKQKKIDIYIRAKDKDRVVYVCSKSRPLQNKSTKPMLYSRICSKIK